MQVSDQVNLLLFVDISQRDLIVSQAIYEQVESFVIVVNKDLNNVLVLILRSTLVYYNLFDIHGGTVVITF